MYDIRNLKELMLFICRLVKGIDKTLEDGKFTFIELTNFIGAAQAIPAAVEGLNEIPLEFKDLSEEEQAELVQYVADEFDLNNDAVEVWIEKAFNIALNLAKLIEEAKGVFGGEE